MKRHITAATNLLFFFCVTFGWVIFTIEKKSIQGLRGIKNNYIVQIFRFPTQNFFKRAIESTNRQLCSQWIRKIRSISIENPHVAQSHGGTPMASACFSLIKYDELTRCMKLLIWRFKIHGRKGARKKTVVKSLESRQCLHVALLANILPAAVNFISPVVLFTLTGTWVF